MSNNIFGKFQFGIALAASVLVAGCLDSGGDSGSADIDPPDNSSGPYTADLSIFGPHPETSVKQSVTEPRYMALQEAEQQKVGHCALAIGAIQSTAAIRIAGAELYLDAIARNEDRPRSIPLGDGAKEAFREHVAEMVNEDSWPGNTTWGKDMAETLGVHIAYKYWQERYEANHIDLSAEEKAKRTEVLERKIREELWPFCLQSVPTECFERGLTTQSCRIHSFEIKDLPGYEVVSDIYSQ